jgi:ankyrin repeat protein
VIRKDGERFQSMALSDDIEVRQILVDAGAKDDGRTELQWAVADGDLEQVKKLIADAVDVNETGPQRLTAVHLASENGHSEILAALIEVGAKFDQMDEQRMRPLHLAANAGIARMLIAEALFSAGIPSHDTIGRVLSLIRPDQFQQALLDWHIKLCKERGQGAEDGSPVHVAIDGKTSRGSYTDAEKSNAIHFVSAFGEQAWRNAWTDRGRQ